MSTTKLTIDNISSIKEKCNKLIEYGDYAVPSDEFPYLIEAENGIKIDQNRTQDSFSLTIPFNAEVELTGTWDETYDDPEMQAVFRWKVGDVEFTVIIDFCVIILKIVASSIENTICLTGGVCYD